MSLLPQHRGVKELPGRSRGEEWGGGGRGGGKGEVMLHDFSVLAGKDF